MRRAKSAGAPHEIAAYLGVLGWRIWACSPDGADRLLEVCYVRRWVARLAARLGRHCCALLAGRFPARCCLVWRCWRHCIPPMLLSLQLLFYPASLAAIAFSSPRLQASGRRIAGPRRSYNNRADGNHACSGRTAPWQHSACRTRRHQVLLYAPILLPAGPWPSSA